MSMDLVRMTLGIPSGPGALKGLRLRAVSLIRFLEKNLMLGIGGGIQSFRIYYWWSGVGERMK